MKGYEVSVGYMGYIGNGKWMLFASSSDYYDYMEEHDESSLQESA